MKNKFLSVILLITSLCLIYSCKSPKETTSGSLISLTEQSKNERINSLLLQGLNYKTISAPLRFTIKPGNESKSNTLDAQLRIIKDEAILLSLRIPFIGTEAAKILITPEQMLIVDRINKQYFIESMDKLQNAAPFDFDYYSLQALFTNHLFIAGKSLIAKNDFNTFKLQEDKYFVYINNKDSQGINYDFVSDYTNRILKTQMYKNKEQVNMTWEYRDFALTSNKRLFPMKMDMELIIPNDIIQMGFSFSKVDIDSDFNIETNVPTKYNQITFEQVLRIIKSL